MDSLQASLIWERENCDWLAKLERGLDDGGGEGDR